MALEFRRGYASIEAAATKRSGSTRSPIVPTIEWPAKEEGNGKYVNILTDIASDVYTFHQYHEWVPVGKFETSNGETKTKYGQFICRSELGEDCKLCKLEYPSRARSIGVGVVLDPVVEQVGNRKKVKSFTAITRSYTRRTDNGEEEVVMPEIGLVTASPITLWGTLGSLNESLGSLLEVPVEITRRGKDQNTRYDVIPFMDVEVDLSPVLDYVDGISYIRDQLDTVQAGVDAVREDGTLKAAQVVADAILEQRIEELSDADRFEELVGPIDEVYSSPYGGGAKKPAPRQAPRPAAPVQEAAEGPSKSEKFELLKKRFEKA